MTSALRNGAPSFVKSQILTSAKGEKMIRLRLSRIAATAATMMSLIGLILSACVPAQQYNALENDYNQLNQQLSSEIGAQQVHITRLQGAIKVAVNSELLFPSGGWQMPPAAAQTIAKMAPILAPFQQTTIIVTGYTDNVPIGPELRQQGVENNQQLSAKRAQTVANFLVSQGVNPNLVTAQGRGDADPVAPNDTPQGRAQNRRVELTLAGSGT
jgi:chemotaxis protein MotB